jgi:hypothetical protein
MGRDGLVAASSSALGRGSVVDMGSAAAMDSVAAMASAMLAAVLPMAAVRLGLHLVLASSAERVVDMLRLPVADLAAARASVAVAAEASTAAAVMVVDTANVIEVERTSHLSRWLRGVGCLAFWGTLGARFDWLA